MRIQRATPVNDLLAKVLFLMLPTLLVCYFLLWNANEYYSILRNETLQQTGYVAFGMVLSALFHAFRFRFLPAFLLLVSMLYLAYKGIDASASGEFDAFFLSIQFLVFSLTFVFGWLIGWGFMRFRFFPMLISLIFVTLCIVLLAKQNQLFFTEQKEGALVRYGMLLGPVILYSVYLIFAAEQIRNYKDKQQKFWWYLSRRLLAFLGLSALLLGSVIYFMRSEVKEQMANIGGGGESGESSMLKKNKDNTFDLQEYTRLRGSLGRSNELLFAAHIDHFFPDSDIPNPLYLTAFYYSKFDTLTETFERDSLLPASDLFEPDPSTIPPFFIQHDSTVLDYALREKFRSTVEIEVYKRQLSGNTFVAPSTSFFVQPITIEKDFKEEFKSAYRAKSLVSELNSAYFVYNSEHPQLKAFQVQRFEILREVKGYAGVDPELMAYYTFMPSDAKFDRIRELATEVTQGKTLPVDKILAIRDFFLAKDENGEPTFSYTDNPGVPDIPDASKLQYFLFENKKGYCAYYAGATLFMLRALGIPSRITVGFMTVDRSNKNKGWYWYYADQAHAWVQVYFPGFGWLDFDTTVGNEDARESPAPDGTPPMQPPKAWLAADGLVSLVDTVNKIVGLTSNRMVFHDVEYVSQDGIHLRLDMKVAAVLKDSIDISLSAVKVGDSATAVSYAEALKKLKPPSGASLERIVKSFPGLVPTDELYVKLSPKEEKEKQEQHAAVEPKTNWNAILWICLAVVAGLALLYSLLPRLIFLVYTWRYNSARTDKQKAYLAYRTAGFYANQLGMYRGDQTPLQYAYQVDEVWATVFASFMIPYLKLKYAGQALNDKERQAVITFLPDFLQQVRSCVPAKKRFLDFFWIYRTMRFFFAPKED